MPPAPPLADWPPGAGQMAALIRRHDWGGTGLGPLSGWPPALRTVTEVMLSSGLLASVAWGPDLVMLYNDEMAAMLGDHHPRLFGQPLLAAVPPDRAALYAGHYARVRRGETVVIDPMPLLRLQGGISAQAWLSARYLPLRDDSGAVVGMMTLATDITARKRAGERLATIHAELQHRTRNLMGVVRSVFEKTLDGAGDLATFAPLFRDRLAALARVQGLLAQLDEGDRITFDALLRAELSALSLPDPATAPDDGAAGGAPRITLCGPAGIRLRSAMVQTFALALHELAAESLRHGALSRPDGRLAVDWRLDPRPDGPVLVIDWRETGPLPDPALSYPSRHARDLIERALPYQLSATSRLDLGETGLSCHIELPLQQP